MRSIKQIFIFNVIDSVILYNNSALYLGGQNTSKTLKITIAYCTKYIYTD